MACDFMILLNGKEAVLLHNFYTVLTVPINFNYICSLLLYYTFCLSCLMLLHTYYAKGYIGIIDTVLTRVKLMTLQWVDICSVDCMHSCLQWWIICYLNMLIVIIICLWVQRLYCLLIAECLDVNPLLLALLNALVCGTCHGVSCTIWHI